MIPPKKANSHRKEILPFVQKIHELINLTTSFIAVELSKASEQLLTYI